MYFEHSVLSKLVCFFVANTDRVDDVFCFFLVEDDAEVSLAYSVEFHSCKFDWFEVRNIVIAEECLNKCEQYFSVMRR